MNAMEREARRLLAGCGLPWRIEQGRKHRKVRVNGHMLFVLSVCRNRRGFDLLELESAIRRARTMGPKT